jgi:hypothetical protein
MIGAGQRPIRFGFEQLELTGGVQQHRRVLDGQQAGRIQRVAQRDDAPRQAVLGAVQPVQGGGQQGGQAVGLLQQGAGLGRADQLAQRRAALREDGLRQTEGRQQAPRRVVADARRERQAQPGGQLIGVHGVWVATPHTAWRSTHAPFAGRA